jgi:multidrug efflux pump subunit AcrB
MTGWLYDGGVLMWIFYPAALLTAMAFSYRLATHRESSLNEPAMIVLTIQLLLVGLCFTGPLFNTQVGMTFWLATAMLYGAMRTQALEFDEAAEEAETDEQENDPWA